MTQSKVISIRHHHGFGMAGILNPDSANYPRRRSLEEAEDPAGKVRASGWERRYRESSLRPLKIVDDSEHSMSCFEVESFRASMTTFVDTNARSVLGSPSART